MAVHVHCDVCAGCVRFLGVTLRLPCCSAASGTEGKRFKRNELELTPWLVCWVAGERWRSSGRDAAAECTGNGRILRAQIAKTGRPLGDSAPRQHAQAAHAGARYLRTYQHLGRAGQVRAGLSQGRALARCRARDSLPPHQRAPQHRGISCPASKSITARCASWNCVVFEVGQLAWGQGLAIAPVLVLSLIHISEPTRPY